MPPSDHPSAHLAQRPVEPEHPMLVEGGVVPGNTRFMLQCLAEEYVAGGCDLDTLRELSLDPNYQALYAARQALGDEQTESVLTSAAKLLGAYKVRVWEAREQDTSATLTISAARAQRQQAEEPAPAKEPDHA